MKSANKIYFFMCILLSPFLFIGCASPLPTATVEPLLTTPPPQPSETPTQTMTTPTFTPTSCTGWHCMIEGVVYEGEVIPGNELGGILVNLSQFSYCSPTMGEHEVVTGEDGTFAFEVYLHDTDSFNVKVELDGYQTWEYAFGGFDCLYCSCPPVEIVLQPEN